MKRLGRKGPVEFSQRQLRVGEEIRHILADFMLRDSFLESELSVASVTVSEVRVSPDLRHAKIFVLSLGGRNAREVVGALNEQNSLFRQALAKRLKTKFIPQLAFFEDDTFGEAQKIHQLLRSERVARDIEKASEDSLT